MRIALCFFGWEADSPVGGTSSEWPDTDDEVIYECEICKHHGSTVVSLLTFRLFFPVWPFDASWFGWASAWVRTDTVPLCHHQWLFTKPSYSREGRNWHRVENCWTNTCTSSQTWGLDGEWLKWFWIFFLFLNTGPRSVLRYFWFIPSQIGMMWVAWPRGLPRTWVSWGSAATTACRDQMQQMQKIASDLENSECLVAAAKRHPAGNPIL